MPLSLSDRYPPTVSRAGGIRLFIPKYSMRLKQTAPPVTAFSHPFITTFLKTEQEEINEGIQRCSYSVAVTWLELEGLGFVKH